MIIHSFVKYCRDRKRRLIPIMLALLVFIAGMIAGRVSANPYGSLIGSELRRYGKGTWLVRIDGDEIGDAYLNERFDTYVKINPNDRFTPRMRDIMLKKLIDNYMVMRQIKSTGVYRSDNFDRYVWHYTEEAMVRYYLDAMSRLKEREPLKVDQKVREEFYDTHREMFDKKGKTREEALKIIDEQISNLNTTIANRNSVVNERIELGEIKKKLKIEYNLKKLSETGGK